MRSKPQPRWIEKALYAGRCAKCAAVTEAGARILFISSGSVLCAPCGQSLKEAEAEGRRRKLAACAAGETSAWEVFHQSDAAVTRRYHAELERRGPAGIVASLLLRAQKSSRRAKRYGPSAGVGRLSYRDLAYERKGESLRRLVAALAEHGESLGFRYGWGEDTAQSVNRWVLYCDIPRLGQVSFHSPERYDGPDYPEGWDGVRLSEQRILQCCDAIMCEAHDLAT